MRGLAGTAGLFAIAATVALVVASAATGTGYGYVSEAGVSGAPMAGLYRAGVFAVALALAFLAAALRVYQATAVASAADQPGPGQKEPAGTLGADRIGAQVSSRLIAHVGWRLGLDRLAGTLAVFSLAAAAPLAAVSGAVPCTNGCPLPPYESASHQDIGHAAASIGGFALAAVAMIVLAVLPSALSPVVGAGSAVNTSPPPTPTDVRVAPVAARRLRAVSRFGAGLTVPLLAAAGLAMLVIGRGFVAGALERAALAASLGWLVAAALTLATTRPASAETAGEPEPMRRLT